MKARVAKTEHLDAMVVCLIRKITRNFKSASNVSRFADVFRVPPALVVIFMFAAINRNDLSLVAEKGFDHKATANDREFFFSGTIDGVVKDDYTVDTDVSLESITAQLPKLASRLAGTCQGVSTCEDRFEFAVGDLSGTAQVYFGAAEEELILSDSFFDVATAMEKLDYRTDELNYFVKHKYCRAGKTWFRGIHRLPPGTILFVDPNGKASIKTCLDDSRGVMVDYQVFKRAFRSTLRSIVDSDPPMGDVVLLSGGVDSSLLLAVLQPMTDVSALTLSIVPPRNAYEADLVRSRRTARTLNVQHDLVDVDFYDADVGPVLALAACMPFAQVARQNIPFLQAFETLRSGQVRAWSGQNCDTLYNLGPTPSRDFVHRFLISEPYLQMLNGVKDHERYYPVKKMADYLIRRFAKWRMGITAQPPQTFEQLSQFFFNSDAYLALSADADKLATKEIKKAQTEDAISAKEACAALYDEKLGSFFTGGDSRVIICSGKLNSVQTVLPYSTANMVHLFRNSGQSWMDVLFPKRYVYKYARELGLSKNSFSVKLSDEAITLTAWDNAIINDTAFGSELASRAQAVEDSLALHSHGTNLNTLLALAWVGNLHKLLEQRGVDIKWPQSELIHKRN